MEIGDVKDSSYSLGLTDITCVYDEYDDYEKHEVSGDKVELPRIHAGFFLALGSIFSPLILLGIFQVTDIKSTVSPTDHANTSYAYLIFITLAVLICFWASSIVKCVSDIALFHSRGGRIGLFLLLISPFVWFSIFAIFTYVQVAQGLAPLTENFVR